ncbi:MAG: TolC family protein [Elusimicrobiota bacterium]|jgi:outer membrane protein TolC|nr:TolC family protein [Elusimicrobiota bacterium]
MKKNFLLIIIFVFSFCPLGLAKTIDWKTVEKITLEINPNIRSARLNLENAKYSYYRALGVFMPAVGLSANASQSDNDSITADGRRGFGNNLNTNYTYGVNGAFTLFNGFADYFKARQASAELDAAKADYDRAVSDAMYKAVYQYINLMWAYERAELLESIKNTRMQNRDMVNLKYNSGNADLGSLRRIEADLETAKLDLRKSLRNIETVSAALSAAIGLDENEILETSERISNVEKIPPKPKFNDLIKTIPEYKKAQYNIESASAQSMAAKSPFLPAVSLSGSFNQNNPERMFSENRINNWNAGLTISYALFNGARDYLAAKIAANNYETAKNNFIDTVNTLKAQVVLEYNSLTDACETIALRILYLAAAELQSEISDRKYMNGLSSYQDWYLIKNDYVNAQNALLEAKRNAALQEAAWLNFIGQKEFTKGK